MSQSDPFADPSEVVSQFAGVQSFIGRLILIEPTKLELNVPSVDDPTKRQDRVTANVTTVDGKGKVEIYARRAPTGQYLEGPEHKGVWFSNDRLVPALRDENGHLKKMVLATLNTWKGGPAGKGNPYEFQPATAAEKQLARDYLAGRMVGGASEPTAADENPFAKK